MAWRYRDVCAALERKGFTRNDTDHAYFRLKYNGKYTGVWTKVSHGNGEIVRGRTLFELMKRQLKINASQLASLFDCTLNGEDYIKILRDNNHIPD